MKKSKQIKEKIEELKKEREGLLEDYKNSKKESERDFIAMIAMERKMAINHLEWVLED